MILNGTMARWIYNRINRNDKKQQMKRIKKYLKNDILDGSCSSRFAIEGVYDHLNVEELKEYFEKKGFKVDIDETFIGRKAIIVKW